MNRKVSKGKKKKKKLKKKKKKKIIDHEQLIEFKKTVGQNKFVFVPLFYFFEGKSVNF
ncbi:hypothetical protein K4E_22020 [Enterococcus thailandicus]|nr:hypothetical protein K4E_22020 [Enterococcus thailandicus]